MTALNGKYVLDRRLGGGGMAEVFLAKTVGAEGFSRTVAVKRVLQGYSENPMFAQMFIAEATLSARLSHPNVVSILDFDRDSEGRLFIVMELVDGADLNDLMQTGLLPYSAVVAFTIEILRGLGYAHDFGAGADGVRGLVHRDVSPHNVLVSWEGAVKVSDFGIAKARSASNATGTEMIKGKPAYMSPEQANGQPLDGRSDLFAVGVMLWEMLCGRMLFAGNTTQETLARLLFAPVPPPRTLRSDVPEDLERVAMRLLDRDLATRYPNAEAAIADLAMCNDNPRTPREVIVDLLVERFPDRAPQRKRTANVSANRRAVTPLEAPTTPLPGPTSSLAPSIATTGPLPSKSRMWMFVAAGLVVAVTISIVVIATRGGDEKPATVAAPTKPIDAPPVDAAAGSGTTIAGSVPANGSATEPTGSAQVPKTVPPTMFAVSIDGTKGATLKIDSNVVGPLPYNGDVSRGNHDFEVSKRGYVTKKHTLAIEKATPISMILDPERAGGTTVVTKKEPSNGSGSAATTPPKQRLGSNDVEQDPYADKLKGSGH